MIFQNFLDLQESRLCMLFLALFKNTAKRKQQIVLNVQAYAEFVQQKMFINVFKTQSLPTLPMNKVMSWI
ncbi:hypothetical protein KW868_11900 [Acinetobacter guillouiae]|uniref:Uncharacterized protein n=2 Tax=Acinetobacter guillouiae TaxID=106649 RepID=A0A8X8GIS0_ACIGI|nr:hypothetical protein [Acinetobacter guillouiae]